MENKDNLSLLETKLSDIEKSLKETITFGLEIIKSDTSLEKKILQMFMGTSEKVNAYFINETVRTGTENIGKSVFKYAIFKKFK